MFFQENQQESPVVKATGVSSNSRDPDESHYPCAFSFVTRPSEQKKGMPVEKNVFP